MVDGSFNYWLGFLFEGRRGHVDYQRDRFVQRKLPRPTHDELFRITVQVLFVERRGVHRVKQLAHLPKVELDPVGGRLALTVRGRIHASEHASKQQVCLERFDRFDILPSGNEIPTAKVRHFFANQIAEEGSGLFRALENFNAKELL